MGNGIGKTVGIVALGGLADMTLEYVTGKYANEAIPVDQLQIYPADLVGTAAGALGIVAGAVMKKPSVTLFSTGALTAALATLLGKTYMTYKPLGARASAGLYAGPVQPRSSGIAPAAAPQQRLVVGTQGGGHVVYKPNSARTVNSNVGINNLFI